MTTTQVHILETPSLGDRSYLVSDGEVALVVDPQRDIDRVIELASAHGLRITHVAETHTHNDYVSGGLELSQVSEADYLLPEGSGAEYDHIVVRDGDTIRVGALAVLVLATPGHTHHHVSYAVGPAGADPEVVLTGGSLLFGSTGRTDLVGPDHTVELTHAQFHSARRLVAELPATTAVLPTHGFGSFCSATPTTGTSSTLADQSTSNPALTLEENEYVEQLLAGLDAFPAYYARMGPLNRRGPAPVDLSEPERVDAEIVRKRAAAGEWVVDLRDRTAFAAGHIAGTLNFELGTNFVTYLGWLLPADAALTLIGETPEAVTEARRELVRIGVDELAGAAVGDVAELAGGPLENYAVSGFADLAARLASGGDDTHVLDTRRNDERAASHVRGSQHIPIHELLARIDEVPTDGEVWVYCGSGYRASIAASMLARSRRSVVHVNESFDSAASAGLT